MSEYPWHDLAELTGAEAGSTALIVGGGLSGANWRQYADQVDFIIAINGAVAMLPDCRYFICAEIDVKGSYIHTETPAHRILHHHWAKRMARMDNVYATWKSDQETDCRNVSVGIWRGPMSGGGGVGTSAIGALHLAGVLGCSRVHSVGIDLCFKDNAHHHWYNERRYFEDLLQGCNQSAVQCKGLETMQFWIESAKYINWWLKEYAEPAGMTVEDHSDGLLQALS